MKRLYQLSVVIILLALFSSCTAAEKVKKSNDIFKTENIVRLTFDIADGYSPDESEIADAVSVLSERCKNFNLDADVFGDDGDIIIEFESEDGSYSEELPAIIGSTGRLEFRDADGNVIMDGSAIRKATYECGKLSENSDEEHYIKIELRDKYVETWADATETVASLADEIDESGKTKNYISIYFDDELQSSPSVYEKIESEFFVIVGGFDEETAKSMAGILKSGQLPFKLEFVDSEFIEFGD